MDTNQIFEVLQVADEHFYFKHFKCYMFFRHCYLPNVFFGEGGGVFAKPKV